MEVDLCFVLDCTGSMKPHIDAAKDCILQVSSHVKSMNPSVKLRFGFCGYRDHENGSDRLEDVLGGLNAAITRLNWRNGTRILFHIGDYPPHGRHFHDFWDKYPDG